MQREERFLEDVLKIFHNSKGSVKNTIAKWQETATSDEPIHVEWKPYPEVPFNHAAGQYEPLPRTATHSPNTELTKQSAVYLHQVSYHAEPPATKLDG